MEMGWIFVGCAWGALIVGMVACMIEQLRKTPQQRKAEGEGARKELAKHWENEKRKLRNIPKELRESMDAESTLRLFIMLPWVMIAVIGSILLIIASQV